MTPCKAKGVCLPFLTILLFLWGCSEPEKEALPPSRTDRVILQGSTKSEDSSAFNRIRKQFPASERREILSLEEEPETLHVFPVPEKRSGGEWTALIKAQMKGVDILFFGERPDQNLSLWTRGIHVESARPESFGATPFIQGLQDIQLWEPAQVKGEIYSTLRQLPKQLNAPPLFSVSLQPNPAPRYISTEVDGTPFQALKSFMLLARCDAETPWMITLTDKQGEEYMGQLSARAEWHAFTFTPGAFISLSSGKKLQTFESISRLGMGHDPRGIPTPEDDSELQFSPLFHGQMEGEAPSPGFQFFSEERTQQALIIKRSWIESAQDPAPIPVVHFNSRFHDPDWSFNPLLMGKSKDGSDIPLLTAFYRRDGTGGRILWCGADIPSLTEKDLSQVIATAISETKKQNVLLDAYILQPAIPDQTDIQTVYKVQVDKASSDPIILQATLLHPEGRTMGETHRMIFTPPFETNLFEGVLSVPGFAQNDVGLRDYSLRLEVLEGRGNLTQLETRELPFKIFPSPPDIDAQFYLKPNVTLFRVGRNALYLNAIDYVPAHSDDPDFDWLDPAFYDKNQLQEDLILIRKAGFNAIRIRLPSLNFPFSFRSLSEEMLRNELLGIVVLPSMDLKSFSTSLLEFSEESALNHMPHWVGLELDPKMIQQDILSNLDRDWVSWCELNPELTSYLTDVPDPLEWESGMGSEKRIRMLRVFANDQAANRIAPTIESIRSLGLHHMISMEMSPNTTSALGEPSRIYFDFRACLPFVDYLTLSEFGLDERAIPDEEDVLALAKLARGLGGGIPLVWSGLEAKLGVQDSTTMLAFQKEQHERFSDLATRSSAAGTIAKRFKDLNQNYRDGLWSSRSAQRPAVSVYTDKSNRLRTLRQTPIPWRDVRFSGDARSDSLEHLLGNVILAQPPAREGIRPAAYGRLSRQLSLTSLFTNQGAPWAELNGAWLRVTQGETRVFPYPGETVIVKERKPLQLTLLNSGPSTWAETRKGFMKSISIMVLHEKQEERYLPLPETRPGKPAVIEWYPNQYGEFELQLYAWGEGPFGPALKILIQDPSTDEGNERDPPSLVENEGSAVSLL